MLVLCVFCCDESHQVLSAVGDKPVLITVVSCAMKHQFVVMCCVVRATAAECIDSSYFRQAPHRELPRYYCIMSHYHVVSLLRHYSVMYHYSIMSNYKIVSLHCHYNVVSLPCHFIVMYTCTKYSLITMLWFIIMSLQCYVSVQCHVSVQHCDHYYVITMLSHYKIGSIHCISDVMSHRVITVSCTDQLQSRYKIYDVVIYYLVITTLCLIPVSLRLMSQYCYSSPALFACDWLQCLCFCWYFHSSLWQDCTDAVSV